MVVLEPTVAFGHGPPPASPYQIISNIRGWDLLKQVRDGDHTPLNGLVNFYPRFRPIQYALTLTQALAAKLGLGHMACLVFMDPYMCKYTSGHVCHEKRKQFAISPDQVTYKVVDVAGHRLYCVLCDVQHKKAIAQTWNGPGVGISIRQAEYLLQNIDSLQEVPFPPGGPPPAPTWTPETSAHDKLRERLVELLRHGAIDASQIRCQPRDVFLYPTGMAAVFGAKNILEAYRPGMTNVQLGFVFHTVQELLEEDSRGGWKFLGKVDAQGLDAMEAWLEDEAAHGRGVAFTLVEFPGNPLVESTDLARLKKMSEKYGFVLIVDDTVGSFSNVDVLAQSDMVLTSLTKSFSGRADVLGGSVVLNPLSAHYAELSRRFAAQHHNQLFALDAETLLANSRDYFERTRRLNDNARAMADFLHRSMTDLPDSPVTKVWYPSLLASKTHYDACLRRSTPELPQPGYGCLLMVQFEDAALAKTFYDRCGFYPSPHLGGHVTIMIAYNMFMFGRDKAEEQRARQLDATEESVRISAGLEDTQDLLDTLQDALDETIRVQKATRKALLGQDA